ncbi:hypothetical protein [Vibrio parahaemolyticus]|uniref:hypothetical protein n=1 Tax=Vibrio parahaemolyticus TaxID=670 RepID=UPI00177DC3BD|nr:hypothetical protein [Vibrio parahaemolyticus]MBD6947933.1 hypothetical protein [Vibrio parahaemolyticus]MBD6959663.1 hypothetical protein [Vibrio parahaemolyticus]MBD6977552.1 hypothetical protein [Vibrio parahaemolyticus]MBD6990470.1 hypothetical protein [Vibrio parahaemolyticus]WOZ60670.1 hypothetical protein RHS38_07430 [Vibrio parahaemolyticus]
MFSAEAVNSITGVMAISLFTIIIAYNVWISRRYTEAYKELCDYSSMLIDDDTIPLEERTSLYHQVRWLRFPIAKYLLLLVSPFIGLYVRPFKKRSVRQTKQPEWQKKFDDLVSKTTFMSGPLVLVVAIVISLLSIAAVYFFVMLCVAFNINLHIDRLPNTFKIKVPTSLVRVVEQVSDKAAILH